MMNIAKLEAAVDISETAAEICRNENDVLLALHLVRESLVLIRDSISEVCLDAELMEE